MKLNKEQIGKIDVILGNLGLDFLDFKLEIKDHIATQTEDLCTKEQINFEEALPRVLKEWEPSLIQKESIWISNKRSFSAIVLSAIKKRYLIYNSISIPLIIGFLIFHFMNKNLFETEFMNMMMFLVSTFLFITLSVLRYFISVTKQETSYSYEFNRIYKMTLIFWLFDVIFYYLLRTSLIFLGKVAVIIYFPIAIYSFIKYKKFIKRLNTI
jgi:hypothetical protein